MNNPPPPNSPGGIERQLLPRDEWIQQALSSIDPAKYAGEGFYATEEYPTKFGIDNPWTRAEIGREGEYYPTPGPGSRWMEGF